MHPVEILSKLHQAQQAGATNPFNSTAEHCFYVNESCRGCPAEDACDFILHTGSMNWEDNLNHYCKDYIDYTYEELVEKFPEHLI